MDWTSMEREAMWSPGFLSVDNLTTLHSCSYTCGNQTSETQPPAEWSLILGMFVTAFVMVVGSAGNLLTLCTLAHQFYMPRRHRFIKDLTADTVFITNLAIADLCYSGINLPFVFVTYYRIYNCECPWEEESSPCKVSAFLRYTNAISEWMTLGLMALERCVCIYKYRNQRTKSKWFTRNKAIIYCILIWCFGMICQLPTLCEKFGEFAYNDDFVKCDFKKADREIPRLIFFALESMVPCILILIGYIIILVHVYSNNSRILSFIVSRGGRLGVDLRRSRTTKVIILLLMVYLVCVIPLCGYNVAVIHLPDKRKDLGIVIYCLYWCQYFINNLIYVVSNGKYRNAYHQFLSVMLCRKDPLPSVPARPVTASQQRQSSVFTITSQNHLQVSAYRWRTISECEEKRLSMMAWDYVPQQDSRASSFSLEGDVSPESSSRSSPSQQSVVDHQGDRRLPLPEKY